LKYYKCIIDNYYIKSITIVKAIYNYIRKKLKIYKAIFFSKIDYNIKNNECIYIYKYILSYYISDKTIKNNNDKIKNERIDNNIPIMKRYLLLYMKYYNYLTDTYYIKSITIVKAIYNYFRKKLKIYKSIFFSRIDYNLQKDDFIYVYKYILTNYINDNYNKINYNNKRTQAILLLDNCNSIIKLDYNKNIKILS
jgi:hypothetical protein